MNDKQFRKQVIDDIVNWAYHVPVNPQDDIFPDQLNAIEAYYDEDLPDKAFDEDVDADSAKAALKSFLSKKDYWDIINLIEYLEEEFKDQIAAPRKITDRNSVKITFAKRGNAKARKPLEFKSKRAAKKYLKEHGDYVLKDSDDDIKPLRVCEYCLEGIEAHEGRMFTRKIYFDEDELGTCDWCEEDGFDTLYEILDKNEKSVGDSYNAKLGYDPAEKYMVHVFRDGKWRPWGTRSKEQYTIEEYAEEFIKKYDAVRFYNINEDGTLGELIDEWWNKSKKSVSDSINKLSEDLPFIADSEDEFEEFEMLRIYDPKEPTQYIWAGRRYKPGDTKAELAAIDAVNMWMAKNPEITELYDKGVIKLDTIHGIWNVKKNRPERILDEPDRIIE